MHVPRTNKAVKMLHLAGQAAIQQKVTDSVDVCRVLNVRHEIVLGC